MADELDTGITLGSLVTEDPSRARVLEALGLDFCCGGGHTLAEACAQAGLDPQTVLRMLRATPGAAAGADAAAEPDIRTLSLTELADHIETTHHAYLRAELPRARALAARVVAAHGAGHAELAGIERTLADLAEELVPHMDKEEGILFPAVRMLERGNGLAGFPFGSLANPLRVMEADHEAAGEALRRLRELSGGYAVPPDGCESYRALYGALAALETDLHRHIHEENNELFRRARELERQPA